LNFNLENNSNFTMGGKPKVAAQEEAAPEEAVSIY